MVSSEKNAMNDEQKPQPQPVWCIRANIVKERPYGPGGLETRHGTKHFAPGAKVYCVLIFWDGPLTSVDVVGHHRGSHRYVRMMVQHEWLTDLKAELVYSPYIISQLSEAVADRPKIEEAIAHLKSLAPKPRSMHAHEEEEDVVVGEGGGEEHGVDAV